MPPNTAWGGGGSSTSSAVKGGSVLRSTFMHAQRKQTGIRRSHFMKCGLNRAGLAAETVGTLYSLLKAF